MFSLSLLRLAAVVCLSALAVSLALTSIETRRSVQLDARLIAAAGGNMYAYELPSLKGSADLVDDPVRSKLALYEDGRRLGPAHTPHGQIINEGAGRYLHLDRILYLSASDNSDVRHNGRTYEITYRARIDTAIPTLFGLASLLAIFFLARANAGGSYVEVRPIHVVESLSDAGGRVLLSLSLIVVAAWIAVLLAADLAAAAEFLDHLRRGLRRIVAFLLVVGSGTALYLALRSPLPGRVGRALALLPLLAIGALASNHPGVFLASIPVVVVLTRFASKRATERFKQWLIRFKRELEQTLPRTDRRRVWLISAGAVAITLVNVLPNIVLFWDQSGWMDSRLYDEMAHDIARGAAPLGNSEYAPMYQYAMAALYWSFGHFFFIQQVANIVLACATAICMCWAAWFFFRKLAAVVCIGLFVAYWDAVHHAVWYTQIENLYLPVFAASLLALASYLSTRSRRDVAWLAAAAALVFCTRQQGGFYVLALALSVLLVGGLRLKERGRQLATYGIVFFLLGVLPWSLRNWHQEDRFSPASKQSIAFLAVFNDPRIPFHAIRYWERSAEVRAEWAHRYPDAKQRDQAMQAYFRQRLLHNTDYFVAAAPWRFAAFYGVLPAAYLGADWSETKQVGLREDWLPQLTARYDLWVPVVLSLVALAWRWRSSTAWLLAVLIGANVWVGLLVGSAEPRNCYPVLLLHFVLATALLAPLRNQALPLAEDPPPKPRSLLAILAPVTLAASLVAVLLHALLGAQYRYRAIPHTYWTLVPEVRLDRSLPFVTAVGGRLQVDGREVSQLEPGRRYRARLTVSTYLFPPRYMKGLADLDPRLALPVSVQYCSGFIGGSEPSSSSAPERTFEIPLRYDGSQVLLPLKEHQVIDAEFRVEKVTGAPWAGMQANWSVVEKAVVLLEPDEWR